MRQSDQLATAGSTEKISAPKQSEQPVGMASGWAGTWGSQGWTSGVADRWTNNMGRSCRWSRIMTLRAPTPEATSPHRPHPFLSTHRARPLSRDVRLWLPKPLSSTPHPHRTAKSPVMSNPSIANGIMHPHHFPIERNHRTQSSSHQEFPKPSCPQIPCEKWCAHPTPS